MAKNSTDRANDFGEKPAGDDRNLVLVDEDFQDADFEDKVWLFWKRHGRKTIAAAVLVFCAILGAIIYVQGKKIHEENLQEEYAQAKTLEARRAFATAHTSDPISGAVFCMLADELFRQGKFEEAAKDYEESAKVYAEFPDDDFVLARDNARKSAAIALTKAGKNTEAKEIFKSLASTMKTESLVRGEAMYNLAVLALAENDLPTARMWLDEMDRSLPSQNFWSIEKRALLVLEPRLVAEPESAPVAKEETPASPAEPATPEPQAEK